jgi:hypothetical protein
MTKQDAEREAIRRWSLLPAFERQSYDDAIAYSKRLELDLEFHTVTNRQKLIAAWLIRELDRTHHRDARLEARAA